MNEMLQLITVVKNEVHRVLCVCGDVDRRYLECEVT